MLVAQHSVVIDGEGAAVTEHDKESQSEEGERDTVVEDEPPQSKLQFLAWWLGDQVVFHGG